MDGLYIITITIRAPVGANKWVISLNQMKSPVSNIMNCPKPENGLVGICRQESQAGYMAENYTSAYIFCIIVNCQGGHKNEKKDYITCPTLHSYPNDSKLLGKMESTLPAAEVLTDIT